MDTDAGPCTSAKRVESRFRGGRERFGKTFFRGYPSVWVEAVQDTVSIYFSSGT